MKIIQTEVVYLDQATGMAYTKEHAVLPLALITASGQKAVFGVLLKPYGDHAAVAWDDPRQRDSRSEQLEKHGFIATQYGQDIVVTEELFERRFTCLGRLTKEVDLEALTRHYESENCDFSDAEGLKHAVLRRLAEAAPGMWACQLYAVLKGFLAKPEPKN
jgi:hypothetical protein